MSDLWNLDHAVQVVWKDSGIPQNEQEMHILVNREEQYIDVECSHGVWITKLRKNPSFFVSEVGLNPDLRIIYVKGIFPLGNISLRSKVPSEPNYKAIIKKIKEWNNERMGNL